MTAEPPRYDPVDAFSTLRIDDSEPVLRAPSRGPPLPRTPRHAHTVPATQQEYAAYEPQQQYVQPNNEAYHAQPYDPHQQSYDGQSYISQDSYETAYEPSYESPVSYGPPQHQQWQPAPQQFNPLYAAASNVLGMGPPPGTQQPYQPQQPPPPGPYTHYAPSQSSLSSSRSAPYPPSTYSGNSSYALPPSNYQPEPSEFDLRPPLNRAGTTFSATPTSVKSKAVDLSAPPYTKEYIDQYRQRIKADPDPEAHFLYAKYLVDAAKHIRMNSKDQRSAKKYTEVLVQEALKVIRRLATQGDAYDEAQFYLANCYGTGALGLQVDHERAYHLYLQAAKQNHAASSYRVAVCNEIGAGTRKEPSRAASFYRKAASLGDTPAMYKLGMILLHGSLGEPKNPREAINWLRRAAEQADEENPHALHELALLHELGEYVPMDVMASKNLLTRAAHLGYTQSQFKLGQCYEYGNLGCPIDPRRSIAWYTKAAEKGDPEAELALSGWYLTGSENVLKQSDSEAYLWARRAANKGLSKAEYAVGYYAEVGIGIKQDIEFAKRWYMRAAAQGNKRAMNRLTEMKRMGNKRMTGARPTRQQANKEDCVIS
ncbi:Chitin synthase regulatory factor 3 [Mycena indigotica]|uniref:Chitin synthase regulatory factor 3 n=1 Tax=Mycena indigotica TaxID=2126181 RepID=A0A8H6S8Z8_9AGAR|nr:Chitin synthase regulatory factor 3 [Mycena indigotica]KAF7295205.1 Chitin synthase regulatory factor 3 [Mycena indigotica]